MNLRNSLLILTLIPTMGHADFYLDLGIGVHASDWEDKPTLHMTNYLASKNPLGRWAFGYEHDIHRVVNISTYFEHTSSIPTKKERGLNVIMIETRINISELFRGK